MDLALQRHKDVDPETDNEQLIEAIQAHLMPDETIMIGWIRDPSYGTLSDHDGSSRTGVEMLHTAADWLTWSLARTATEVVQAMRKGALDLDTRTAMIASRPGPGCQHPDLWRGGVLYERDARRFQLGACAVPILRGVRLPA